MNTRKQGDVGVGSAISYFLSKGYEVSIPIGESHDYDLVVDIEGLKRIQVKTTSFKSKYGVFFVSLTTKGGNRSGIGRIKAFNKDAVDFVFVLTSEGKQYLVPSSVCHNSISLGKEYDKFCVGEPSG